MALEPHSQRQSLGSYPSSGSTTQPNSPGRYYEFQKDHKRVQEILDKVNKRLLCEPLHSAKVRGPRWIDDCGLGGLGLEYSYMRKVPAPPLLFLRHGSRFKGEQKLGHLRYNVNVEIKYVDLEESSLYGDICIQGLTESPSMTYFEGEIIGTKYSFITQRWGATEMIDFAHWAKLTPFQTLAKWAEEKPNTINSTFQEESLFMRWKQMPLTPHNRVPSIGDRADRGFYYICLNRVTGQVHGYYFDKKENQ